MSPFFKKICILLTIHLALILLVLGYSYADDQSSDTAAHAVTETIDQKTEQKQLAAQEREQKKQEKALAKQKAREEKAAKKAEEKRLKEEKEKQEKQAKADAEASRQKTLQEEAQQKAETERIAREKQEKQKQEQERLAAQEREQKKQEEAIQKPEEQVAAQPADEARMKREQQQRDQEAAALKKQIAEQKKQKDALAKQKAREEKVVRKAETQRLHTEQKQQKEQAALEEAARKNARKEAQQKMIQEERVRKAQEALQKQEQKRLQEEEKIKQELNNIEETASEERLWRFAVLDMYATGLVYPDVIHYASEMMRKYIEHINNTILIPQQHIEVLSQEKGITLPSDEQNQNDERIQSFGTALGVHVVVVGYIKKIPRKNEYVCTIKEIRTDTGQRMGIEERTFPGIEREIEYAVRGMIENFYNDNKALLKQPAPLCTPIVTSTSLVPSSAGVSTEDMPISTTIAVDTTTVSMSQPVAIDTPTVSYAYDYAIIPFVPLEGMSHNDMRVVTEEVEQHLAARYMVTISETQLAQDNNLSDDAARAIGTTLNAHYVVCGNCAKVMEQYLVTVRAIDVATGATVFNDHTTLEHINTIVDIARIINERWDKNIQ